MTFAKLRVGVVVVATHRAVCVGGVVDPDEATLVGAVFGFGDEHVTDIIGDDGFEDVGSQYLVGFHLLRKGVGGKKD